MEQFSVGNVLGTGFRVWFRNLLPFLIITSIIFAPYVIWIVVTLQGELTLALIQRLPKIHMAAGLLLNVLVSSALVYGVVMELKGERASVARCISTGLSRFFPVLGVALLTVLAIGGGLILLVIPGLIALCTLYVAVHAAVIERPGVFGALRRSAVLTSGYRWQIFAILVLLFLMNFGLQKLLVAMISTEVHSMREAYSLLRRAFYLDLAVSAVTGSLSATLSATAYYLLRRDKEGTDVTELSRVFE